MTLPSPSAPAWFARVAIAALAVWLGGLVFYATLVIPAGAEVLGGHTAFGFVTREVTNRLNLLGSAVLAAPESSIRCTMPQRAGSTAALGAVPAAAARSGLVRRINPTTPQPGGSPRGRRAHARLGSRQESEKAKKGRNDLVNAKILN